MPDVTVAGLVRAPPEKVYAFVSDFTNWPRWQSDMKSVERVQGQPGRVGAKYHYRAKAMGQHFDSTVDIVSVVPGRSVSFEGEWQGMIRPKGTYTVDASPGGTVFTAHLTPEARGMGKIMTPLMNVMIRRINRKHLERLRKELE